VSPISRHIMKLGHRNVFIYLYSCLIYTSNTRFQPVVLVEIWQEFCDGMRVTMILNKNPRSAEGETIYEILEKCGYTIESVILLRENQVILEEEVSDDDIIELLPVASGG
jgi:sulfur carrier protein ThiS